MQRARRALIARPSPSAPADREVAGLRSDEVEKRLARYGRNLLSEPPRASPLRRFLANVTHLFALLLWAGAALAALAGMPELSIAIVVVVLVNASFAYAQEHRAERATEALKRLMPVSVRVRRDGVAVEIPAEELVPGDLVLLAAGDRVSADAELLQQHELRVDNSTLTGESWPVRPEKSVFAGTFVVAGSGEAVVTATGMSTEFGRIASLTQEAKQEPSPLELELRHVTRFVAVLSVGIGTAFFLLAGALGMSLTERFVFAIGVMVANVPEGLLPTVTLSLALATQRMAKRNALVRRLSSVETLGETTVVCTDKTGTLTENEMTVVKIWTPAATYDVEGEGYEPHGRFRRDGAVESPAPLEELLRAGLLCNDSRLSRSESGWSVVGDPTEAALVVAAAKGGLDQRQEAARYPRVGENPFDSRRRMMSTVHLGPERWIAYVKGAPEAVFEQCGLGPEELARAERSADELEESGLRVLALATRSVEAGEKVDHEAAERDLELLGLVAMLDPPRAEVPVAVRRCQEAGMRVVMVTGDSGRTAKAIGCRIGLVDEHAHVVEGPQLEQLDDAGLVRLLDAGNVLFARIDPDQKLRLAHVLRARGEVVAMTGDGVNDAPALKEADIGVAMGRRGTDVAKETADMVLLDDNFASVVAAVEEGRAVYDNIRRFTMYHFCSNVAELIPFLVWGLSGGAVPLPLVVMQVLAIDLGTDMLPAIALGTERAEPGVMERRPRPRSERLLSLRVLGRVYGWVGLLEGLGAMASFFFAYFLGGWRPGMPLPDTGARYVEATTMTQTGIVMGQVGSGMAMRTNRRSVFAAGLLTNRFLLFGIAFELALAVALVYVPGLNAAFHQGPLGIQHWLFLAIWPFVVFSGEELRKLLVRRLGSRRDATRPVAGCPVSDRHGPQG